MAERKLNDWLESYLKLNDNTEPPYMYHLWVGISTIAAVLERKCFIDWDRRLYPNMYIVIVGPSGVCRKGTAMYPSQRILREIGVKMSADATTREALIRELNQTSAPVHYSDGGVETASALTIFSKEFSVFLGYQNTQLIMDLTDWYDCDDRWIYNTKDKTKRDEIHGVWVNMLGATTPNQLRESLPMDAIGGGLTSRIIFIYEDRKEKVVALPFRTEIEMSLEKDLLLDLMEIHRINGSYKVTKAFLNSYVQWYDESEQNPQFSGTFLEPYSSRRATHMIKLCMILNASRGGDKVIDIQDLERAKIILQDAERKMPFTFSGIGLSDVAHLTAKIISIIAHKQEIWISELLEVLSFDADKATTWRVLDTLRARKRIDITSDKNRDDHLIKLKEGL